MKILVISDTHGRINGVWDIWKKHGGFDAIFHLGDHEDDAYAIAESLKDDIQIFAVRGNCDGALNAEESTKNVHLDGFNFYLTHGHACGVNYDLTNLYFTAKENGADVALFGHTHRAFMDETGDIKMLNPGSISAPRDGTNGTYAIINIDNGIMEMATLEYKPGAVTNKQAQGGFLRRTFNDSDGQ